MGGEPGEGPSDASISTQQTTAALTHNLEGIYTRPRPSLKNPFPSSTQLRKIHNPKTTLPSPTQNSHHTEPTQYRLSLRNLPTRAPLHFLPFPSIHPPFSPAHPAPDCSPVPYTYYVDTC
ncbi:hypothetical protein BDV95DRAFT_203022 [Massariosphaeria phaeospora]|uniref:Uncharacterized protein n=1 Tax=Massariosphaeria phaeospora TaxID=100035 RepID=A0A7C8M301_9PLEO|nr:hypothetical protein BDV95DRAFT_203022 [Massariosphaeria phaeospora]